MLKVMFFITFCILNAEQIGFYSDDMSGVSKEQKQAKMREMQQDYKDLLGENVRDKSIFKPLWLKTTKKGNTETWHYMCVNGDGEKSCTYAILKPFSLKGVLTLGNNYKIDAENECDLTMQSADFRADSNGVINESGVVLSSKNAKAVRKSVPKWLLEGFAGSASFEVEITPIVDVTADFSAWGLYSVYVDCGKSGTTLRVTNIKFVKKLSEKRENMQYYKGENLALQPVKLRADSSINLHDTPNGKIIASIKPSEFSKVLILRVNPMYVNEGMTQILGLDSKDFVTAKSEKFSDNISKFFANLNTGKSDNIESKWVYVLYFPNNDINAAKGAYLHTSQFLQD